MKKTLITAIAAAGMFSFSSCSNYDSAAKNDAATGAAAGALLGGIVGHQSGRALEGAALGGAVGGAGGYMVGNEKDKRYYR